MIIHIKVHPGAKEENIRLLPDGSYLISIKERAEKGKANTAIIRLLSKTLNITHTNINIKNPTSRRKMVEIVNMPPQIFPNIIK